MTNNASVSAPRISFASLNTNNLGTVRKLNSVLFPINYSEKFYRDILQPDVEEFCKLSKYHIVAPSQLLKLIVVYYNDIPVCRDVLGLTKASNLYN